MLSGTPAYVAPQVVSAAVLIGLLAITWRNRSDAIAPWFAATLLAFLVWTVGFVFEIVSGSLAGKIWWADFQFIGITVLPVVWFEVVRRYTGRASLPRAVEVLLGAYIVVTVAMVYVNPDGAFRGMPSLDTTGSPSVVVPDYGWYWVVATAVLYLLLCTSIAILIQAMWRDRHSLYRRQYALLLVAVLLPVCAGTLYVLGIEPGRGLNPTTAVVSISGACMAYALFRYRLFDIAPVARGAVVDGLSDGVIVLDTYDRIVDYNPAARQLFPGLTGEALGRPVSEVLAFHPGLLESIGKAAAGEAAPDTAVAELSMSLPGDGPAGAAEPESRHFTLALTVVRGRAGRVIGHSVLLHDVTRSVELLRQIERLATTDPLTELLTRAAFLELGEREMTRARLQEFSVWLVLLDLDHFGLVNDVYGSDAGDEMLRAVARAIGRVVQTFDLVGRYAGEEFAALLPHLSESEAMKVAERLRRAVAGLRLVKDGRQVSVTASVGVAGTEAATREYLGDLVAPAERALRVARERGRDRVECAGRS